MQWIKVETHIHGKPEVLKLMSSLGINQNETVGLLLRFWMWADAHISDGNAPGVTGVTLDHLFCYAGFAEAMQKVGWLEIDEEGIRIPNWEYHNGKSAKTRAQTQKRVQAVRSKSQKCNGDSVTDALPEKRREEKNIYKTPNKSGVSVFRSKLIELGVDEQLANEWIEIRKNKKAALTANAIERLLPEVKKAGLSVQQAIEICCERAWQGFKAEWLNKQQWQPQAVITTPRPFHQD